MFSSDQLALILAALVIVGLVLAGMLAIVVAANRRSRAARLAAARPRGSLAASRPIEGATALSRTDLEASTLPFDRPAMPAGGAAERVEPLAGTAGEPAVSPAQPTVAAPAAAAIMSPAGQSPGQIPFGVPTPSEAPVLEPTPPPPDRDFSPLDAGRPEPGEADRDRRFVFDNRTHEPRADEAIAGYLGLDPAARREAGPPVDPMVDPATGLDTLLAWERMLVEEGNRYARYRRPVAVVVAELDGLARLVDRVGAEAARRVLPAVGDTLRRYARRTDHVAHAGGGRFLMLLPETDEIQAINYVERVRAACERWLEAGAVALHLSMGWASPTAAGGLETAVRTAEDRMYAERHRGTTPATPDAAT